MAADLFEIEQDAPREGSKAAKAAKLSTILLRLYVQSGAGKAAVTGTRGDALHVRVAPPPIDGRANVACAELVAELLGVPKSAVELVSGERNRMKRLRVRGVDVGHVRRALDDAVVEAETRPGNPRHGRVNR